jgi:hypothetical protein
LSSTGTPSSASMTLSPVCDACAARERCSAGGVPALGADRAVGLQIPGVARETLPAT